MKFKYLWIFTLLILLLRITQQFQVSGFQERIFPLKKKQQERINNQSKHLQKQKKLSDLKASNEYIGAENQSRKSELSKKQTYFINNAKSKLETTFVEKNKRLMQQIKIDKSNQTTTLNRKTDSLDFTIPVSPKSVNNSLGIESPIQIINPITNSINRNLSTEPLFSNIILHHKIPSNFLLGQIFTFKGHITTPTPGDKIVVVIFKRIGDGFQMDFTSRLKPNQTVFTINAYLKQLGQYNIAIFTGLSGRSAQNVYTISKSLPSVFTAIPPIMVRQAHLVLKSNDLYVQWSSKQQPVACITKLIFSQGIHNVTYIVSNFQTIFQVPYADFHAFKDGVVSVEISQAFSSTQSAYNIISSFSIPFGFNFNAVRHNFAKMENQSQLNTIPIKVNVGDSFVLSGRSKIALLNQVYLQTPSKKFIIYNINPNTTSIIVPAQTYINITIEIIEEGVYILQINKADGSAIYNAPIYSGDIYPLLPDFVDLSPKQNDLTALSYPTALRDRQNLVLNLINKVRAQFNASSIYLDQNLNNFAQKYSELQVAYNFIGHVDPQGRTLKERLANANITYGVSQNLALDMNLTEAEFMLQRSPAHLKNTVNPNWTRVGLGIAQNRDGYYYLTQEFSYRDMEKYPLTSIQMADIRRQIFTLILNKYPTIKSQNKEMSNILSKYQLDNDLITYLKTQNTVGSLLSFKIVVSYEGANYMDLIKGQLKFTITNNYTRLGLLVIYTKEFLNIVGVFTT